MSQQKEIIIPISKSKIVLLLIASVIFVVAGACFFLKPEIFEWRNFPPIFIQGVGLLSILFFGTAGVVAFKKLLQKTPGLIINDQGITDATSGVSTGLIDKADITGVRKKEIMSTKILLIDVSNPEKYIAKAPNKGVKKLLEMNHKQYGTPLSINSNTLKIKFDELENMLMDYVENR